jgi:hypothetical protein
VVDEVSEHDASAPIRANDDTRWRRLIFEEDAAFALTMADAEIRYRMRVDSTTGRFSCRLVRVPFRG